MSQPDLFVVCKNCGSEVSPYVTECPYCGQRVRKRAPKLERDEPGAEVRPKERRRRLPKLSRLRPSEIEGIAPDTRPVATFVLIGLSLAVSVALAGGLTFAQVGGIVVPLDEEPWRYATSSFVHDSLAYQFATMVAVGIFGTLLERRFGWFAPIVVFVAAGAAGMAAAVQLDLGPLGQSNVLYAALGANGAALGLLTAWLVDDLRATRRGDQRGNDLVGVAVIAVLLLLLPLAVTEANPVAGPVGALVGGLLAPLLGLLPRRV